MRTELLQKRPGGARRGAALSIAALLIALSLAVALGSGEASAQAVDQIANATSELQQNNAQQSNLQAQIAQQNAEINSLISKEADLHQQEASVQAELDAKQAELDSATQELRAAQAYLHEVKQQLEHAKASLRKLLVRMYKSNPPDMVDVVLESVSWTDAIAQAQYLHTLDSHQDAVIGRVSELRDEVIETVESLAATRARIQSARDEIAARRDELASARQQLEDQHAALEAAKQERQQTLAQLQDREQHLQNQVSPGAVPPGGATATIGSDGLAIAPANAPLAVKAAIEAANSIANTPYVWGGGHGSFESSGYDCSGSVSFALHGAGVLSTPLDSTGLETYGDPGPGSWITVYANSGHAYAVIAGLRWDTSGTDSGTGPSWYSEMRSSAGYVVRHPPGL